MTLKTTVVQLLVALPFFLVSLSAPAQADSLQDARARIDALTDAQITTAVANWIRSEGGGCRVQLASNTQEILEKAINATLFEEMQIEASHRGELSEYLVDRVDDTMDTAMKDGLFFITKDDGQNYVMIKDCS